MVWDLLFVERNWLTENLNGALYLVGKDSLDNIEVNYTVVGFPCLKSSLFSPAGWLWLFTWPLACPEIQKLKGCLYIRRIVHEKASSFKIYLYSVARRFTLLSLEKNHHHYQPECQEGLQTSNYGYTLSSCVRHWTKWVPGIQNSVWHVVETQ